MAVVLVAEDTEPTRRQLAIDADAYEEIVLLDDWKRSRMVDLAVVDAHRRHPIERVVSLSECDVVRAAQLREWLGLPGQSVASAVAFRDKVVMKDLAMAAGVRVPRYRRVEDVWDVVTFRADVGLPIVVKPVDGAGAVDVVVLRNDRAVDAWIARQPLANDEPPRLMVEEYIDAPLVTVDGVTAGGSVITAMVNGYRHTCHTAVAELTPLGVLQLDREHVLAREALATTRRLVAGFPTLLEATAFHLELFAHPRYGMVLCEVAARTGGGRIREMARHALGVDLERWSCLGQAGIPTRLLDADQPAASDYIGFIGVPSPGRRLVSAPPRCPLPGVCDYAMHLAPGEYGPRAIKASQFCVDVLFRAPDAATLHQQSSAVLRWLHDAIVWADADQVTQPVP
jgi:hypothetical protein